MVMTIFFSKTDRIKEKFYECVVPFKGINRYENGTPTYMPQKNDIIYNEEMEMKVTNAYQQNNKVIIEGNVISGTFPSEGIKYQIKTFQANN